MNKLKYSNPATKWTEALPLGNGHLGGMHYGGIETDEIQLNEDTLWSGSPRVKKKNSHNQKVLRNIRTLIDNKQYGQANKESRKMFSGYTESYMPFGSLFIHHFHGDIAQNYLRTLDIEQSISSVQYQIGQVKYYREIFFSHPHDVMVVRLSSSEKNKINVRLSMDSPLNTKITGNDNELAVQGVCPEVCEPPYFTQNNSPIIYGEPGATDAIHFDGRLRVKTDDGVTKYTDGHLLIQEASEVFIYLSISTSFEGFNKKPGKDYIKLRNRNRKIIDKASNKTFNELKNTHIKDYQELFNRVSFKINSKDNQCTYSNLDTDEILTAKGAHDDNLIGLLFQYGRYLLISSSRRGSQPANLQGIWNPHTRAPWSSNYTLNINTPMNYWPAEVTNLSECHEPLIEMIKELSITGENMVSDLYGIRGWTAHHNTDIWRHSYPVGDQKTDDGDPVWTQWPMSGPWLARHLWEHYLYNQDVDYLREEAFPLLKKSAEFCLDWLIEDESGYLITSPSTSPENKFIYDGKLGSVTKGSTMDLQIIRDLFTIVLEAAEILAIDGDWITDIYEAKKKIHPLQINKKGQLQEWLYDYEEEDPHHRHVSHLYGLYPGNEIRDSELLEAIEKTLNSRGDEGTGWSLGWKILLWARLYKGDRILVLLEKLFSIVKESNMSMIGGGLYPNLLGAHPPFQIDGNFSFTAGIAEMLVQSYKGYIELLPALPSTWITGKISGLRIMGGHQINIHWENNNIKRVKIKGYITEKILIKENQQFILQKSGGVIEEVESDNGFITLDLVEDETLVLLAKKNSS